MYSYEVDTSNNTNIITAVARKSTASVSIKLNGAAHTNGQAATWLTGINTVEITVTYGTTTNVYTIIVTKSGSIGSLTVASAAGTAVGDTKLTITGSLTSGFEYRYKTAASVDLPGLDDNAEDWTEWNGTADITATTGHEIVVVEASLFDGRIKKAGKATVTSKAS